MRPPFALAGGAAGEALSFDDDRLRLDSDRPVPPGSRVEGTVDGTIPIRGKVIEAARGATPGRFVVSIKLADLSRDDRGRLAALLPR